MRRSQSIPPLLRRKNVLVMSTSNLAKAIGLYYAKMHPPSQSGVYHPTRIMVKSGNGKVDRRDGMCENRKGNCERARGDTYLRTSSVYQPGKRIPRRRKTSFDTLTLAKIGWMVAQHGHDKTIVDNEQGRTSIKGKSCLLCPEITAKILYVIQGWARCIGNMEPSRSVKECGVLTFGEHTGESDFSDFLGGTAPVEGDGGSAPGVIGGTTTTVRGDVASAATIDAEADVDAAGDVEAGSSGSITRGGCSESWVIISIIIISMKHKSRSSESAPSERKEWDGLCNPTNFVVGLQVEGLPQTTIVTQLRNSNVCKLSRTTQRMDAYM
ncbi:hypothetical protein F5J12DRAFT_929012 [Pisolithus orientalis]|uniref:uncharacterized protein n=1 Tax=Pisolithus orientalis TaxID=936130 RepID=UPI0022249637|nr:uncharacterized protein F5J12DRAFT_929012 [Pisolithus orientalis]KAI5997210.1 hypothetical protein F5J12DRAFT_929012 [Pisolithus orientalis]